MWYIPIALLLSCTLFFPVYVFFCETRLAAQCHLGSCYWGIRTKRERKVTAGEFAHAFFARCSYVLFCFSSSL